MAHRPGLSFCCVMASADSVTKTSARLARISSKIVTFSPCCVSLACLKLARAKRSLLPPGLKITLTSGRSIWSMVWYLDTSAQRADVSKYQTMSQIDRPEVVICRIRGGSNERFARAQFKHAKLTQHGENVTIFDEILANRADVFVTESREPSRSNSSQACARHQPQQAPAVRRDGLDAASRRPGLQGLCRPVAASFGGGR